MKHLNIGLAAKCINNFVSDGSTVKYYAGFPKFPKRAMDFYIIHRKKDGDGLVELAAYRKQFTQLNDAGTSKFKKMADDEKKRYIDELSTFLEKNRDHLLDSHIKFINRQISNKTNKPSTPKKKKTKKSAFDMYVSAYEQDYSGMDEEKKMRKLQRKFDKLEDHEKQLFERLAEKN